MIATATKRPITLSRLRAMTLRRVRGPPDPAATTDDNRHDVPADDLVGAVVDQADALAADRDVLDTLRAVCEPSQTTRH